MIDIIGPFGPTLLVIFCMLLSWRYDWVA